MSLEYQKIWDTMNNLEMTIAKAVSAREMIDIANESISYQDHSRAELMTQAAFEFLEYFIDEFDEKFKLAWQATVGDFHDNDIKEDPCMPPWGHSDLEYACKHKETLTCDKDDPSPECKGAWNSFWEENYYPEEFEEILKRDGYEYTPLSTKADGYSVDGKTHSEYYYDYTRNDSDRPNPFIDKVVKWQLPVEMHPSGEAFVIFPDDLLEAANLKEGDTVEWVDKGDGSYFLRKVTKPLGMDEC